MRAQRGQPTSQLALTQAATTGLCALEPNILVRGCDLAGSTGHPLLPPPAAPDLTCMAVTSLGSTGHLPL